MGLFDKMLAEAEEGDRAVLRKYPWIKEWDEKLGEWESWKANNYDPTTGMTKNALTAIQQRDQEIEALRVLQGNDMTWDEMKGNVEVLLRQNGVVTRRDLETDVLPKLQFVKPDDLKAQGDKIDNLEKGVEMTYAKTSHLPLKYFREFGDLQDAPEFTNEALFNHMREKRITDFDTAYNSLVSPLRAKKQEAASKVREEELRKQVREETLKEVTLRSGALPVDDKGGSPESTPLMRRIAEKKKLEVAGPKLTPGELGSGAGANDAYQGWLQSQAGKVQ